MADGGGGDWLPQLALGTAAAASAVTLAAAVWSQRHRGGAVPAPGGGGRVIGIIPARYASSRFPGKPLAPILGKPMVQAAGFMGCLRSQRTWEQARQAASLHALGAPLPLSYEPP
eukprot:SM000304S11848  [mRNA]  locus=s304:115443:115985:+ [translate_table: standard]